MRLSSSATDRQATPFLEREILLQGRTLRDASRKFPTPVNEICAEAQRRAADDWVVTGCGDSLFAGLCAEVWWAELAGLRLRAVHAMEFSRYLFHAVSERSIVIAVSHSGTTARAVEAARAARARGAYVVAVTANCDSELAKVANLPVDNMIRHERSNTRTSSFQSVAYLMRVIAERLASTEPKSDVRREETSWSIDAYVGTARAQVDAIPSDIVENRQWYLTGAGLGHAVAEYGSAKLYEAASRPAHAVELEQLVHCEIFTVNPKSTVVLVAPRGPSICRAREVARGLMELEVPTLAITDDEELADVCTAACWLPGRGVESDLPFLGVLPLQWLALRVAVAHGEDPDRVANKWVNRPLIDNSVQWGENDYLWT